MKIKKLNLSNRAKMGGVAWIISAVALALAVLLNILANVLAERYNLAADLTPDSVFRLSKESADYVSAIDKDLKIIVLAKETDYTGSGSYFSQANEIIRQYAKISDKISVSYVDLLEKPTYLSSTYPNLTANSGDIIIDSGEKQNVVSPNSLINQDYDYTTGASTITSKAEQTMTSAIMKTLSGVSVKVMFLTETGEQPMGAFSDLFSANNYEIEEKSLVSGEIDGADIAVLAPGRDLTKEEVGKLDKFLENGGNYGRTLFYFGSAAQPETPNLDAFLKDWGLGVDRQIIAEGSANKIFGQGADDAALYFFADPVADSEYAVSSTGVGVAVPYTRSVSVYFESQKNITVKPLVATTDSAVAINMETSETAQSGPYTVLAMAQKLISDTADPSAEPKQSQIIAGGSNWLVSGESGQSYISEAAFSNGDYFINITNKLYDSDAGISIAPKSLEPGKITVTSFQALFLLFAFVILLPVIMLVLGIVLWAGRKNL
ncbi:MAG: GldG family protein [Oscillospiraceae bacterium]|jgi:ABC-type uncharacterized transport system involved in gliding motility auxiliary subunit|nr:GldG family protein [Oscillospiraceae bacterium]